MTPEVEKAYQFLGNHISRSIQGPWIVAWIGAEIESEDEGCTYGRYIKKMETDVEVLSFPTNGAVYEAFAKIRRLLNRGEEPWTQAVFTLRPGGKFTLDFSYGPLEGSQLERMLRVQAQQQAEP